MQKTAAELLPGLARAVPRSCRTSGRLFRLMSEALLEARNRQG
jgi:hypothetical protein